MRTVEMTLKKMKNDRCVSHWYCEVMGSNFMQVLNLFQASYAIA